MSIRESLGEATPAGCENAGSASLSEREKDDSSNPYEIRTQNARGGSVKFSFPYISGQKESTSDLQIGFHPPISVHDPDSDALSSWKTAGQGNGSVQHFFVVQHSLRNYKTILGIFFGYP
ncbi:hypothetical protein AVEN_203957-1 [Araneus ventricosus]|uniref:Uncharacterized protein n=1 Tax=Araneus ventricosus TaxID=182803 RepID=A0A4Y2SFI2_ARAVE|nr:hypothetical protein AVEN_203957-1 [Araneus ventricosus]